MTRPNLRASVLDYCDRISNDPLLVQGAGGNVSWKEDGTLWVKASGTWLSEAKGKDIFVPVDFYHLREEMRADNFGVAPNLSSVHALRPSIETLLHGLMPQDVVVHLHALEPLAHLVRANAELGTKLQGVSNWALVPYRKPGEALARAVCAALAENPKLQIVLLQNHGVVIGGASVDEVDELLRTLTKVLSAKPQQLQQATVDDMEAIVVSDLHYDSLPQIKVHDLARIESLYHWVQHGWALYPDHVVFLGPKPFCCAATDDVAAAIKRGDTPEFFFLEGQGVFALSGFNLAKQLQLLCYYEVICRLPDNESLRVLEDKEVAELLNWDAERYRQRLQRES